MILQGDCREVLAMLDAESIQCVVTSPPYWGLRDYGVDGQLGLEPTPDEYVANMVEVFREVRRVLRPDGTLWLNLGDSYTTGASTAPRSSDPKAVGDVHGGVRRVGTPVGLKPKDLVGIPWRVAFALQADGWWLRSDVIWSKPNPMPESVTDRPTKAHEYVFLLTKSERYFYDHEAIADPVADTPFGGKPDVYDNRPDRGFPGGASRMRCGTPGGTTRNARTVWTIPTRPFPEAHFATFPPELARRCILAGTSERGCCPECGAPWVRVVERETLHLSNAAKAGTAIEGKGHVSSQVRAGHDVRNGPTTRTATTGWRPTCDHDADPVPCKVLDPFGGSGTTGYVAQEHGRQWIAIELNPEYIKIAKRRTAQQTLFGGAAEVEVGVEA